MTAFVNDDGQYLDYSGPDVGITKQVASFFDFKIKGDISATLKIANNAQNRNALGYYGPMQVNSPAFSKIPFNMVKDGNYISRGYVVINDSDDDTISVFYISGNTNWFQNFQFNLKDTVFPDRMTVLWSDVNSRKAATEGIVFPLVDWWGNGSRRSPYLKIPSQAVNEESEFLFGDVHPAIYLHTLVEYAALYAGISIGGDLMDDELYKKIILTNDGPDYFVPDSIIQKTYARLQNGPFGSAGAGLYDYTLDPNLVRLSTLVEGLGQVDTSLYAWYAPLTGTYRIDFDFWVNNLDQYTLDMYVNDVLFTTMFNQTFLTRNKIGTAYANFRKGDKVTFYISNTLGANYRLDYLTDNKYTNIAFKLEKVGAIRPAGNLGTYTPVDTVAYVIPNEVVPDMKAIELIKFLAAYFGCVVTYDEYSNTIELNKLANFKKEDADDWSAYFVSASTDHKTGVAKYNRIQTAEGTESDIKAFNEQSNVMYGGGTIETDFDSKDEEVIYELPFSGSWDVKNKSYSRQFFPYINFYDIEYGESVAYSGVTSSGGGFANFTCTFNEPLSDNEVFWVVSTLGIYTGFAPMLTSGSATTNPTLLVDYIANDTGTIVRCKVSKVQGAPRMLVCNAGMNLSDAGGSSTAVYVGTNAGTTMTTGCVAWFDKPKVLAPIDSYHESLAIDSINQFSNTISERYYGPIKKIFNNPKIDAQFTLPLAKFQKFAFDRYIRLNTKNLSGYFIVQKIENYKDALTPIKVELLYAD